MTYDKILRPTNTIYHATGNSTIIPKIHKSAILSYNILLI